MKTERAAESHSFDCNAGFSVTEFLVVLGVFAVLTVIALTDFFELKRTFDRNNARNLLMSDIRRAQSESLQGGARGIISINAGANSYNFGMDFPPYSGTNVPDQVVFRHELPDAMTVASSAAIVFDSRGALVDSSGNYTTVTVTLTDTSAGGSSLFANASIYPSGNIVFH